jgi:hypothetical protein
MRFDSQEHIDKWYRQGHYPAIHAPVVSMAVAELRGVRGVDVCCSHGLLGTQLLKNNGLNMLGVDGDRKAITLAREHGIPMPIHEMKITRATMKEFFVECVMHGAQFLIMRRCAPELFGDDLEFGREFFSTAQSVGIQEIVLEGRVRTPRATNKLSCLEAEIELTCPLYQVHKTTGNVAYLRAVE